MQCYIQSLRFNTTKKKLIFVKRKIKIEKFIFILFKIKFISHFLIHLASYSKQVVYRLGFQDVLNHQLQQ